MFCKKGGKSLSGYTLYTLNSARSIPTFISRLSFSCNNNKHIEVFNRMMES